MVRPDGAVIWVERHSRAYFDEQGKMLRIVGMVADIIERKRAEEALRESEDKLRLLLDSTAEATYGIDLEHRCTFCNPACLRTLGYEHVDEVLGKNMHNLIHYDRADGTLFPVEECRVHRVTRTGQGVHADDECFGGRMEQGSLLSIGRIPSGEGTRLLAQWSRLSTSPSGNWREAALANVSRKLIEAQEQERTRIGRELHDDIGQRLALLAVELQQLHENSLICLTSAAVGELQKQIMDLATDIQSLSHELHSAKQELVPY